tara:strand:+ start:2667 stop:2846 length:180 start_codon:yes stop_codon:yes gene_type:complete
MGNKEQVVTRQNTWELQVCDNTLGAYSTYLEFHEEELALSVLKDFKFRLVQKALIEVEL